VRFTALIAAAAAAAGRRTERAREGERGFGWIWEEKQAEAQSSEKGTHFSLYPLGLPSVGWGSRFQPFTGPGAKALKMKQRTHGIREAHLNGKKKKA
jgi:hypothetical protein